MPAKAWHAVKRQRYPDVNWKPAVAGMTTL